MSFNTSNNHDERAIEEDRPQMRSMALVSRAPEPTLFGAVAVPPPLQKRSPFGDSITSPEVKTAPTADVSSVASWDVSESMIQPVPPFYQLERTHVVINEATNASIVARRITDHLKQESIATAYNNDEASIEAETCDGVLFYVRLWLSQDKQLVVEVQRSDGCSYRYCQVARALLRAAKGIASSSPPRQQQYKLPSCIPRQSSEDRIKALDEGLAIASCLLHDKNNENRIDCHRMALESLVQLTSPSPSSSSDASCCSPTTYAAKSILHADSSTADNNNKFRDTLIGLIQQGGSPTRKRKSVANSDKDEEHNNAMRRCALTVLANCLSALEESGELTEVLECKSTKTWASTLLLDGDDSDLLLRCLVNDVQQCDVRPHDACEALRTLSCLVKVSASVKDRVRELLLTSSSSNSVVMATASQEGLCRHARLYEETRKLQLQIL